MPLLRHKFDCKRAPLFGKLFLRAGPSTHPGACNSLTQTVTLKFFCVFSVTLFELTVVNNWYIIMVSESTKSLTVKFQSLGTANTLWCVVLIYLQEGYVAVTSEWSRLYFMSFYIATMVRRFLFLPRWKIPVGVPPSVLLHKKSFWSFDRLSWRLWLRSYWKHSSSEFSTNRRCMLMNWKVSPSCQSPSWFFSFLQFCVTSAQSPQINCGSISIYVDFHFLSVWSRRVLPHA